MDWIRDIIVQLFVTAGLIVPAWLTLRGKLAGIGEDSAAAKKAATEIHDSINNRSDPDGKPIPLSDRLDQVATKDDLDAIRTDVKALFDKDKGLRGVVNAQGRRLDDHIEETAPMLPMLQELHARYVGKRGGT